MQLFIDSKEVISGSFHLNIGGVSIEVLDISKASKIDIVENSGNISVEILPVDRELIPSKVVSSSEQANAVEQQSEALNECVSAINDISQDLLFQKLVALRRQIAKEVKLPPFVIFHNTSLKDMVSRLPVDLESMKDISGVGQTKLEKYGIRFIDAIKEYLAESA